MAKHYIRLNKNNFIIKTFSTDFEQPQNNDICVNEDGGRHFNLELFREDGLPALRYVDGKIVETTDEDFDGTSTRELEIEKAALVQSLDDGDWRAARQMSSITHKMSDEEYAAFIAERDKARDRVDEIKDILDG